MLEQPKSVENNKFVEFVKKIPAKILQIAMKMAGKIPGYYTVGEFVFEKGFKGDYQKFSQNPITKNFLKEYEVIPKLIDDRTEINPNGLELLKKDLQKLHESVETGRIKSNTKITFDSKGKAFENIKNIKGESKEILFYNGGDNNITEELFQDLHSKILAILRYKKLSSQEMEEQMKEFEGKLNSIKLESKSEEDEEKAIKNIRELQEEYLNKNNPQVEATFITDERKDKYPFDVQTFKLEDKVLHYIHNENESGTFFMLNKGDIQKGETDTTIKFYVDSNKMPDAIYNLFKTNFFLKGANGENIFGKFPFKPYFIADLKIGESGWYEITVPNDFINSDINIEAIKTSFYEQK